MPFKVILYTCDQVEVVDPTNTSLRESRPHDGCHFVAWTNGRPGSDDHGYEYTELPYTAQRHAGQTIENGHRDTQVSAVLKGLIQAAREKDESVYIYSESPRLRIRLRNTVNEVLYPHERRTVFHKLDPITAYYPIAEPATQPA